MRIQKVILDYQHQQINKRNLKRLKNTTPTLICSNCAGGFIYHWLGLQFRSPFINLFLTPEDFVTALENLDEFIDTPIREFKDSCKNYPVGIGAFGIKVYFMHYKTFDEAIAKWNERKKRIDKNNMGVMLTNYAGGGHDLLKRFDALPYKHKVVFVPEPVEDIRSAFYLRKYDTGKKNLYRTISITGKRCIDQFDYVGFINSLQE